MAAALVEPLLGGGSTVVVAGPDDPERLARISADGRVGTFCWNTARPALVCRYSSSRTV